MSIRDDRRHAPTQRPSGSRPRKHRHPTQGSTHLRRNRTASSIFARLALAGLAAVLGVLLGSATASAAPTFTFDSNFTCSEASPCIGAEGGSETSLGPAGSAVDEATGDVYVIDKTNNVIDRFSSSGTFLSQINGSQTGAGTFNFGQYSAIAVDNSGGPRQGYLYVVAEPQSRFFAFDPQGELDWEESTEVAEPCGVAVDSQGDPWILNWSRGIEERSAQDGAPVSDPATAVAESSNRCYIGFDSADNLYSAYGNARKYFAPAYTTHEDFEFSKSVEDLFIDSSEGILYQPVGSFGFVGFDTATGEVVSEFGGGGDTFLRIAGNSALGRIYGAPNENRVAIFVRSGGALPKPSVRTGTTGLVTATSALIDGQVNPNGATTACEVQYVADLAFQATGFETASTAPCAASAGSGTAETPVSASLSGLAGGTTYHYRLLAISANGTTVGSSREFSTSAPMQELDISISGSGAVQCDAGSGAGACEAEFPEGTEVIAIATAAAHNHLVAWTGCDSVSGANSNECHVTIGSSASSIGAEFAPTMRALTVATGGTGSGSVSCNGGACAGSYQDGTEVTLVATPAAGSSFAGWSGGGCTGTGSCKVTLGADTAATATFDKTPVVTPPTTQPPVVNPRADNSAAYGQCVAKANKAFAKAKKAAKRKHGKAKAKAIKRAKKRKTKAVAACEAQFK